jgi:hypothetical protein
MIRSDNEDENKDGTRAKHEFISLDKVIPQSGICLVFGIRGSGKSNLVNNMVWLKTPAGKKSSVSAVDDAIDEIDPVESKGETKSPVLAQQPHQRSLSKCLDAQEYPLRAFLLSEFGQGRYTLPSLMDLLTVKEKEDVERNVAMAKLTSAERLQKCLALSFEAALDDHMSDPDSISPESPEAREIEFDRVVDSISPQWERADAWNRGMRDLLEQWFVFGERGTISIIFEYAQELVSGSMLVEDEFYSTSHALRLPRHLKLNKCLVIRSERHTRRIHSHSLLQTDASEVETLLWIPSDGPFDVDGALMALGVPDAFIKEAIHAYEVFRRQWRQQILGYECLCVTRVPSGDGQWRVYETVATYSPEELTAVMRESN